MRYCQLVSNRNRILRYHFACLCKIYKEMFDDVIFIDEATVEIRKETYKRWYKKNVIEIYRGKVGKPRHNPKVLQLYCEFIFSKNFLKVHIFGGISKQGAISCVIFEGKLDSQGFQKILKISLLPFINENYVDGSRVIMDNDSKHVSRSTKAFFNKHSIAHFKTPAQSPVRNFEIYFYKLN